MPLNFLLALVVCVLLVVMRVFYCSLFTLSLFYSAAPCLSNKDIMRITIINSMVMIIIIISIIVIMFIIRIIVVVVVVVVVAAAAVVVVVVVLV